MLEANSRSSSSSCVLVNAVRILLLLGSWLELLSGGGGVQRGKRSDSCAVGPILWYATSGIPGLWSFPHLFAPNETHRTVTLGASLLSRGTQIFPESRNSGTTLWSALNLSPRSFLRAPSKTWTSCPHPPSRVLFQPSVGTPP